MKKQNKIITVIILILFLIVLTIINYSKLSSVNTVEENYQKNFINNFNKHYNEISIFSNIRIIFFIDFIDFSCSTCEDEVISLIKLVENYLPDVEKKKVLLLVRKISNNNNYNNWLVKNFIEENGIKLKIQLDEENIFGKLKVTKTSIALIKNRDKSEIEYKIFPMVKEELNNTIKSIGRLSGK